MIMNLVRVIRTVLPSWLGHIEPYSITKNMFGTISDKQS